MLPRPVRRREFVKLSALTATGVALGACAQATPAEPTSAPTQVPAQATAKPADTAVPPTAAPPTSEPSSSTSSSYKEAPMLAELVAAGELPPVEQRLPENPVVIEPHGQIGKYGGTIRYLSASLPGGAWGELTESLIRVTMGGKDIIPNFGENWDADPDGKVYTVHLRKGIRWSDGEPFTADDIVFWANDVVGNKDLYPGPPNWFLVAGKAPEVTKIDDYTVRFTYEDPAPLFIRALARAGHETFCPKHYLEQFHAGFTAQEDVEKLAKDAGFDSWVKLFLTKLDWHSNPDSPVLWAWKLEKTSADSELYNRNAYYMKVDPEGNQLPYIDTITCTYVANKEVAQMKAFAGECDLNDWITGQYPADTQILKKNANGTNYRIIDAPISEPNVMNFGLNLTYEDPVYRQLFNDKRFRIALSHAINREDIRELVYLGQPEEIRQCAPLRRSDYYHEGAAQNYVEYDPDKANALLDEMGLTERDGQGFRLGPDGNPITIVIEVMATRTDFQDDMEMVATYWREVGINATSKAVENTLYFSKRGSNQLQCGVDYCQGGLFPLEDPRRFIPVDQNNVWASAWGLWWSSKGASGEEPPEEVKHQLELYDQATSEVSKEKRIALWKEIMDIHAENMYHFGICDRATVPHVIGINLQNVPDSGWDCGWEGGGEMSTDECQYWKDE